MSIAGAGGSPNLHRVARVNGKPIRTPFSVPGIDAVLESYVDDRRVFCGWR
jgi:hypothetical protein